MRCPNKGDNLGSIYNKLTASLSMEKASLIVKERYLEFVKSNGKEDDGDV
jgi:hypothetical protein